FVFANVELPSGATANRTMDAIEDVENYFLNQPQVENMVSVRGFSFNGNGLNAGLAFVTLKDFNERRGPGDSAQAVANKAMGQLLYGIPDAMVFSIVPPAIMELGNAQGFDMRLEDRGGLGHDALMEGAQQLMQMASESPVLTQTRITGLSPGQQWNITIRSEEHTSEL